MPSNWRKIIEQAKFTYSLLGKAFEKQTKTIENQEEKQIKAFENRVEKCFYRQTKNQNDSSLDDALDLQKKSKYGIDIF